MISPHTQTQSQPTRQRGFTLLEMLLVIGMIGLLAAIALTRYQDHIVASNRQAARAALVLAQQDMERAHLQSGTYVGAALPAAQPSDTFVLNLTGLSASGYTLNATPKAGQTDELCGTLSITQNGAKGATGTGTALDCWE